MSEEIDEYNMGYKYYVGCIIFDVLLFYPLNMSLDELVLGFALITLTGIDMGYREIPNIVTQALMIVALFSIGKVGLEDIIVYFVMIVMLLFLNLKGGIGGGDFKLYCSMLVITPGFIFLRILIWCSVYCLIYSIFHRKDEDRTVPMAPFIFFSFLTEMILKI